MHNKTKIDSANANPMSMKTTSRTLISNGTGNNQKVENFLIEDCEIMSQVVLYARTVELFDLDCARRFEPRVSN